MTTAKFRLSRKETYAGSMVIFLSLFYMLPLLSSLFQRGAISTRNIFGPAELKILLLSLLYLFGGILLFTQRNAGWIICTATLLNFVLVVFMLILTISREGSFSAFAAMTIAFFVLLLMAIGFLFNRETRKKFMVNNRTYLLTMGLYLILVAATFLL